MRIPAAQYSLIVLVYFAIVLSAAPAMLSDADLFWHLATGDLIRESGTIPLHDPWSYTAGDTQWINLAWLWDVLYSVIYSWKQMPGVLMATAVIFALIYTLDIAWAQSRGTSFLSVLLVTFFAISVLPLTPRSQQATYLFAVIFAMNIEAYMRGRASVRALALLPGCMVLWANMHGGFITGFIIIGAYGIDALWHRNRVQLRHLTFLGIACALALFFVPREVPLVEGIMRTLNGEFATVVSEWLPTTGVINNLYAIVFLVMMKPGDKRFLMGEKILLYFWCLQSISSMRNLPVFMFLSMPVMAMFLDQYLVRKSKASHQARPWAENILVWLKRWHETVRFRALALLFTTVCLLFAFTKVDMEVLLKDENKLADFMSEELAYIYEHYPNLRLLTDYNIGGVLIFKERGKLKLFVDGRAETAYPRMVAKDYINFYKGYIGWEKDLRERYDIEGILLGPELMESQVYDRIKYRRGWVEAFKGKDGVLFVREDLARPIPAHQ